jgi:hypothetical protein
LFRFQKFVYFASKICLFRFVSLPIFSFRFKAKQNKRFVASK